MSKQDEYEWMRIASQEVGQKEIAGNVHNRRIVEYHATTTLAAKQDEVPWCASFVNWCLAQSKMKRTRSAAARSFLKYGTECELRRGCVVVLSRGSSATAGHVGFCARHSATHVWLLGGNQSDAVSVARFRVDRIIGCRWPEAEKKS